MDVYKINDDDDDDKINYEEEVNIFKINDDDKINYSWIFIIAIR